VRYCSAATRVCHFAAQHRVRRAAHSVASYGRYHVNRNVTFRRPQRPIFASRCMHATVKNTALVNRKARGLRDDDVFPFVSSSVCLFLRLSPVFFHNAVWDSACGGFSYRLRYTCCREHCYAGH